MIPTTTQPEARAALAAVREACGNTLDLTNAGTRDAIYRLLHEAGVRSGRIETSHEAGGFRIPRPPARELADVLSGLRLVAKGAARSANELIETGTNHERLWGSEEVGNGRLEGAGGGESSSC